MNYKVKGGRHYRLSLDRYLKRHIATKDEAQREARQIMAAIDAGTFRGDASVSDTLDAPLTVERLGLAYFTEATNRRTGDALSRNERYRWDLVMRTVIERPSGVRVRFGELPVAQITRHDVAALQQTLRGERRETCTDAKGRTYDVKRGGKVSANRCLGRLRSFFSWAVDKDYVPATPFRKADRPTVKMFGEAERERRLLPGDEERLLAAANPHLQSVIIAALETGCRVGELLSLQWSQVRFDLNELHLSGKTTKARRPRYLPLSQRLRAVLEMRKHDPDGAEYPGSAFVFGTVTGERIKSVDTAWENCRLKAFGFTITRDRKTARLSAICRQQLRDLNLHIHDLRRESGSRFLEHGMAPHYVKEFLDHANLSTTSRYLKTGRQGMHAAMKSVEQSRTRCTPVAHAPLGSPDPAADRPSKLVQ
jgi:integrase